MTLSIALGDLIGAKYRVERILGQGGMGIVVEASHLHLPQRVAIKFLLGDGEGAATERFLREARVVVRLKGDHVVRVLDVGQLDGGHPYMVMEYLEGSDLGVILKARDPLDTTEAVDLLLQVCEAIVEAHAAGIVHRDIKPANVFLTKQPDGSQRVKVLDFGISKDLGSAKDPEGKMTLTGTAEMLGSPLYMSPEQMKSSRRVDARTDIWSLGALAYRMVTGTPPFPAETITELVLAVTGAEQPRAPREIREALDPALESVILRCLSKDPTARFQSVAELATALAPLGSPGGEATAARVSRVLEASPHKELLTSSSDQNPKVSVSGNTTVQVAPRAAGVALPGARSSLSSDSDARSDGGSGESAAHAISASAARRASHDSGAPGMSPRERRLKRAVIPVAIAVFAGIVLSLVLTRTEPQREGTQASPEHAATTASVAASAAQPRASSSSEPPDAPTVQPAGSALNPPVEPAPMPPGTTSSAKAKSAGPPVSERRTPQPTTQPAPPPRPTGEPTAPPTAKPPALVEPELK